MERYKKVDRKVIARWMELCNKVERGEIARWRYRTRLRREMQKVERRDKARCP